MRIAIDLTSLSDNLSGLERYALKLTEAVLLKCRDRKDISFILAVKKPVPEKVKELGRYDNVRLAAVSGGKLFAAEIRRPFLFYGLKPDIAVFPCFPVPFLYRGGKKRLTVGLIADTAAFDVPETMKKKSRIYFHEGLKHTAEVSDIVLTISEFSKGRIQERLPAVKRIAVTYCGAPGLKGFCHDTENAKRVKERYGLPDEYLLALSTVEPRKNVAFLAKGYAGYLKKGGKHKLVFAGRNGWLTDEIYNDLPEITKGNMIFTGFIEDDDLPYVYSGALAFLDASIYEGFGLPPLEAAAYGVSRLYVSDIPAHREVLEDAADYFKNGDEEAFVQGLIKMLTKESDMECIDNRIAAFSWEKSAEIFLKETGIIR